MNVLRTKTILELSENAGSFKLDIFLCFCLYGPYQDESSCVSQVNLSTVAKKQRVRM